MLNHRSRQRLIPKALILGAVALAVGILAACDTASRLSITPAPTATAAISATSTLPPLAVEKGWHVALTLGNTSATTQFVSGSFTATKPYKIFFQCMGSGTLRITYPKAEETAPCGATPELNGTSEFSPPAGTNEVTISVATQGDVRWNAIAVTQD